MKSPAEMPLKIRFFPRSTLMLLPMFHLVHTRVDLVRCTKRDDHHWREYLEAAKSNVTFRTYLERYVYGVRSQAE
jgi:hypothetical protein